MRDELNAHDVKTLAADWRDRRDREDWSEGDQASLDSWLAQSSAHMIAYLRVDAAWARADRLGALHGGPARRKTAAIAPRARNLSILFRTVAATVLIGIAAYLGGGLLAPNGLAILMQQRSEAAKPFDCRMVRASN